MYSCSSLTQSKAKQESIFKTINHNDKLNEFYYSLFYMNDTNNQILITFRIYIYMKTKIKGVTLTVTKCTRKQKFTKRHIPLNIQPQ